MTGKPVTANGSGQRLRGLIAWMTRNRVTPNLLMIFFLVGGFYTTCQIKQEVFPEFELDMVSVQVPYPGAGPEEVEQGIILPIEQAVRGLDGVKEIRATASEGVGTVTLELLVDADQQRVHQEIEQAVDRIRTFPRDAEEPQVTRVARRREVLDLVLYGDVSERVLRDLVEQVRDQLLQHPEITQTEVVGGRNFEIHVEIPQQTLRSHGLTLQRVAAAIGAASVEVPGGQIETRGGELLLRVMDRKDWAHEFATIPVLTTANGSVVLLGDIAEVREGFADQDRSSTYNGKTSIGLEVYRVGDQTPIGVSDAVRVAMAELQSDLPDGVDWAINRDRSTIYRQRLELLLKNAFLGLALVLLLLGLFLEFRVAFWVTMGIPTAFLGALLFLPSADVSINMISMFAFIVALGIVVDDAIVAGENIYEYRSRGMSSLAAAIHGARDVAIPISFSILTNIVAFLPLYFVPGTMGKIWQVIPIVVIVVFLISWIESLFILPAHLAHGDGEKKPTRAGPFHRFQRRFAGLVNRFIEGVYGPLLGLFLRWRIVTIAVGMATLIAVLGFVASGRIGVILMPRVESDTAAATAVLPPGSPPERVESVRDGLVDAVTRVARQGGGDRLLVGTFARIDGNKVEVFAYLTTPEIRPLSTAQVTRRWRREAGPIAGLQSLRFQSDRGGPGSGASLTIELSHRDIGTLDRAGTALAEALAGFPNVKDIDDGSARGKEQLDFQLTRAGQSLGLTSSEVARQVRNAFYGAEAVRQQRQRHEVKVLVRRPASERSSEYDIESLFITTPAGRTVPLREVATVIRGRSYNSINRRDARRTLTVTADVDPIGQTNQVMTTLNRTVLPSLVRDFPGLAYSYQGRRSSMRESASALRGGFLFALVIIYFLLAIPFRSYAQPLIVMIAIPFGVVGAVFGHVLMGYNVSLISMMGMVALSGVVVNDSLVLVNHANRQRAAGADPMQAIRAAGMRRFRPVVLTTLTTFGGLAPMIFETSRQARFLIPMALSLGFGILFATAIVLILVPSLYVLVDDARALVRALARRLLG